MISPSAAPTQLSSHTTCFGLNLREKEITVFVKGISLDVEQTDNFLNHGHSFACFASPPETTNKGAQTTYANKVPIPREYLPRAVLLCAQNVPHPSVRSADGACDVCPSEIILKRFDIITTGETPHSQPQPTTVSSALRLKEYSWSLTSGHHWQITGPARVGLRLKLLLEEKGEENTNKTSSVSSARFHTVPIMPTSEKDSYAQHPKILLQQQQAEQKRRERRGEEKDDGELGTSSSSGKVKIINNNNNGAPILPSAVFGDITISVVSRATELDSTEKLAAIAAEERAMRKINGGGDDHENSHAVGNGLMKNRGGDASLFPASIASLVVPAPRRDWRLLVQRRWYMIRPEVRQATVRDSFFARHKYEMSAKSLQMALDEERAVRHGGGKQRRGGQGLYDEDEEDEEEEYTDSDEDDDFDSGDEESYGVLGRNNMKKFQAEEKQRKQAIADLRAKAAKRKENLEKKNGSTGGQGGKDDKADIENAGHPPDDEADLPEDSVERMAQKFPTLEQRLNAIRLNAKEKYSGSVHEAMAVSSCGRFVLWRDGTETPMAEVKPFEKTFVPSSHAMTTATPAEKALSSPKSKDKKVASKSRKNRHDEEEKTSAANNNNNNSTSTCKDGLLVYRFPNSRSDVIGVIPFNTEATAVGMVTNKFTGEVFVCWKQLFKPHEHIHEDDRVPKRRHEALSPSLIAALGGSEPAKETYKTHHSFTVSSRKGEEITAVNDGKEKKDTITTTAVSNKGRRQVGKKATREEANEKEQEQICGDDSCPALIPVSEDDLLKGKEEDALPHACSPHIIVAEGIVGWSLLKGFSARGDDKVTTVKKEKKTPSPELNASSNNNKKTQQQAAAASIKEEGESAKKKNSVAPSTAASTTSEPVFFLVEKKLHSCLVFPTPRYFTSSRTDRGVRVRAEPNLNSRQIGVMEANEVKEAVAVHVDRKGNVFVEWQELASSPGYDDASVTPVPNTCDNATAVSYSVVQEKKRLRQQQGAVLTSSSSSILSGPASTVLSLGAAAEPAVSEPQPAIPATSAPPTSAAATAATDRYHHSSCTTNTKGAKRSSGGYSLAHGPQGVAGGTFLVEIFPFNRTLKPLNFVEIAAAGGEGDTNNNASSDDEAVDRQQQQHHRESSASTSKATSHRRHRPVSDEDDEIIDLDKEKERRRRANDFVRSLNKSRTELIKDPTTTVEGGKRHHTINGLNDSDFDEDEEEEFEDEEEDYGFEDDEEIEGEDEDEYSDDDDDFSSDYDDEDPFDSWGDDDEEYDEEEDEEDWGDYDEDDAYDDSDDSDFMPAPPKNSKGKQATDPRSSGTPKSTPTPATKKKGHAASPVVVEEITTDTSDNDDDAQPHSKTAAAKKKGSTSKTDKKNSISISDGNNQKDGEAKDSNKKKKKSSATAAVKVKPIVEEPLTDGDGEEYSDSVFDSDYGSEDYERVEMDEGSFTGSDDADEFGKSSDDDDDDDDAKSHGSSAKGSAGKRK